MHTATSTIADRIGGSNPCFIIAEVGVNHNGSIELALEMIDVAAECGVDAVKFQTFNSQKLVTATAPQAEYQAVNSGKRESQLEMLRRLEITAEDHKCLMERCQNRGVEFMSTPFDEDSVDVLADLGMRFFKISSGEATNLPLLKHIAAKRRPVILSTGMCNLADVEQAVETLESLGITQMAILHCVSCYPAAADESNLRAMHALASFGYPVGYSDHTLGNAVAIASVALGAKVIEKHFTLDRNLPGPDHVASSEPGELRELVKSVRSVEASLGDGRKRPVPREANTASVARRSLVAARNISAGQTVQEGDLVGRRPGTGLPTSILPYLQNRTARRDIIAGEIITLGMFS